MSLCAISVSDTYDDHFLIRSLYALANSSADIQIAFFLADSVLSVFQPER